jgi:hypothetical protein
MKLTFYGRRGVRKKGDPKPRYPVKNVSRQVVLDTVRKELKDRILTEKENVLFTAEELATISHFKLSKIQWALHRLNLEGLMTQGSNEKPHDIERSSYYSWGDKTEPSGWNPTWYTLIVPFRRVSKPTNTMLGIRPFAPAGCFPVWDEQPAKPKPRYSKRTHSRIRKVA